MLRADKTLLLAKIEDTYGTDPTPTKSANAFIATNVKVDPVFKMIPRLGMNQAGGAYADLVVGEGAKITFDTELYPAPSANALPTVDPFLQACSFTISGGTSTPYVYTLNLNNFASPKSCTIWVYFDEILHKITGCVGTMKLNAAVNDMVKLSFEFTGLYSAPTEATMPLDSTFNTNNPLVMKNAAMQFDSTSFVGTTLDIDCGNTVAKHPDWNNANGVAGWYVSQISPSITIDPEAMAPNTLNYWTYIDDANPGAFTFTLDGGTRDVVITSENCVMTSATDGVRDTILTKNITLLPKAALNDATYAPLVLTFS